MSRKRKPDELGDDDYEIVQVEHEYVKFPKKNKRSKDVRISTYPNDPQSNRPWDYTSWFDPDKLNNIAWSQYIKDTAKLIGKENMKVIANTNIAGTDLMWMTHYIVIINLGGITFKKELMKDYDSDNPFNLQIALDKALHLLKFYYEYNKLNVSIPLTEATVVEIINMSKGPLEKYKKLWERLLEFSYKYFSGEGGRFVNVLPAKITTNMLSYMAINYLMKYRNNLNPDSKLDKGFGLTFEPTHGVKNANINPDYVMDVEELDKNLEKVKKRAKKRKTKHREMDEIIIENNRKPSVYSSATANAVSNSQDMRTEVTHGVFLSPGSSPNEIRPASPPYSTVQSRSHEEYDELTKFALANEQYIKGVEDEHSRWANAIGVPDPSMAMAKPVVLKAVSNLERKHRMFERLLRRFGIADWFPISDWTNRVRLIFEKDKRDFSERNGLFVWLYGNGIPMGAIREVMLNPPFAIVDQGARQHIEGWIKAAENGILFTRNYFYWDMVAKEVLYFKDLSNVVKQRLDRKSVV